MAKTYIADKETLDSVKTDTGAILENLSSVGVVKSVQTGEIKAGVGTAKMALGSNGTGNSVCAHYIDVTISKVDVSKAVVICDSCDDGSGTAYLVDGTKLRVIVATQTYASYPSDKKTSGYTRWQVVEYN